VFEREAVDPFLDRNRQDRDATGDEVQPRIAGHLVAERGGAPEKPRVDRGQRRCTVLQSRRAGLLDAARLCFRVERGEFGGIVEHQPVVAFDCDRGTVGVAIRFQNQVTG